MSVLDETLEGLRCDNGISGIAPVTRLSDALDAGGDVHRLVSYITQDALDTAEQLRDMLGEVGQRRHATAGVTEE